MNKAEQKDRTLGLERVGNVLTEIMFAFLEFMGLYERTEDCLCCGEACRGLLCIKCWKQLVEICGDCCVKCGRYLDWNEGEKAESLFCEECKDRLTSYDLVISCYEYNGLTKELLHRLKYSKEKVLAEVFAPRMAERLVEELSTWVRFRPEEWILVPVPVSNEKLEERGYNQAMLMAECVGQNLGRWLGMDGVVPVRDLLTRRKDTVGQHKLTKTERNRNILGAFSVKVEYNIAEKKIILVDDIFTTGSTAEECAKVLKRAGCRHVIVLTASGGGRKRV